MIGAVKGVVRMAQKMVGRYILDENFPDSQRLILAGWRHNAFHTVAQRMGCVLRVAQPGITLWRMRQDDSSQIAGT